jgi:hypothetical protein
MGLLERLEQAAVKNKSLLRRASLLLEEEAVKNKSLLRKALLLRETDTQVSAKKKTAIPSRRLFLTPGRG